MTVGGLLFPSDPRLNKLVLLKIDYNISYMCVEKKYREGTKCTKDGDGNFGARDNNTGGINHSMEGRDALNKGGNGSERWIKCTRPLKQWLIKGHTCRERKRRL